MAGRIILKSVSYLWCAHQASIRKVSQVTFLDTTFRVTRLPAYQSLTSGSISAFSMVAVGGRRETIRVVNSPKRMNQEIRVRF